MRRPRHRRGNHLAVGARGFLGEPLDVAGRIGHFAAALGQRLALFARDQAAQVFLVREHQVVPALEDLRALLGRHGAPGGEGGMRRIDRGARIGGRAVGHAREHASVAGSVTSRRRHRWLRAIRRR
jgi:hypothetical protein